MLKASSSYRPARTEDLSKGSVTKSPNLGCVESKLKHKVSKTRFRFCQSLRNNWNMFEFRAALCVQHTEQSQRLRFWQFRCQRQCLLIWNKVCPMKQYTLTATGIEASFAFLVECWHCSGLAAQDWSLRSFFLFSCGHLKPSGQQKAQKALPSRGAGHHNLPACEWWQSTWPQTLQPARGSKSPRIKIRASRRIIKTELMVMVWQFLLISKFYPSVLHDLLSAKQEAPRSQVPGVKRRISLEWKNNLKSLWRNLSESDWFFNED